MKMILVYDVRRDIDTQEKVLSRVQDQFKTYLKGLGNSFIHEGIIEKLYFVPYEGEHRFILNEGNRSTSWIRLGDVSWYVVGRKAKVEETIFNVPHPIGDMPLETRIWIGDETAADPKHA